LDHYTEGPSDRPDRIAVLVFAGSAIVIVIAVVMLFGLLLVTMVRG
jgi:hypothetical protein